MRLSSSYFYKDGLICWLKCRWYSLNTLFNKKSRIYGTSDSFAKINLICQICQRVRSVRESDLWGRSVRPWESDLWGRESPICEAVWESDRPLTHTGRCSPILGAAWLISRLNALLRPVCVRGRSDSHGLTDLRGRVRERLCAWEAVLSSDWLRQITWQILWGRGNERPNSASHGLSRPLTCEAEVMRGRIRPLTASHGLSPPRTLSLSQSNDWKQGQRVHGRPWEAVRGRIRPLITSASPISLKI